MPNAETGHAAFTLTEVMIAVALMLLALGLLLSAFVSSRRSASMAQTYLAALQIARTEAEQVQTNAYTNIAAATTTITNEYVSYTLNRSVTNILDKYMDITIAVQWTAPGSGRPQALSNYMTICNPN